MAGDIVDLHAHFFTPEVVERLSARADMPRIAGIGEARQILSRVGVLPLGRQWFDLDHRLAALDRHGIAHQLLSWPTTLGLEPVLGVEEAKDFWRAANDGLARLVRRYPARFSALAVLSTADVAWSVEELRRTHGLGLIGCVLPINALADRAGVAHLAPLLAEVQRLGAHLYLHTGDGSPAVPGQPAPVERPDAPALGWTLAVLHHFASAFATVALTDAFDDYPDVTVQVAMLGGAGAAALLLEQAQLFPDRLGGAPDPRRLHRLLLDTGAAGQGPAALRLAVDLLGADRIAFGSDHGPAADIAPVLANVAAAVVADADRAAILRGTGATLLARHGVTLPACPGAVHV